MVRKQRIYLDTSIISAYWYHGGDDLLLGRRAATRAWWDEERDQYDSFCSAVVVTELRRGRFSEQKRCIRMAEKLRHLPVSRPVRRLVDLLFDANVIPRTELEDAFHLALAVVHNVDFLLTWNYAHLANPHVQRQLQRLCQKEAIGMPLLVSPESMPQV